jgi:hypothetical protein
MIPGRILDIQDIGETALLTLQEPSTEPDIQGETITLHIEGRDYKRGILNDRLKIGGLAVFMCDLKDSHAGGYTLSVNTDKRGEILYFPPVREG